METIIVNRMNELQEERYVVRREVGLRKTSSPCKSKQKEVRRGSHK